MDNTQVLQFPLKGVSRAFSRSTQPDLTAYEMLNVLPFDRTNRLRGGKRPGTSKLWANALGSGTQTIQLLDQTTIALDPSTIEASTLLVTEPFTYSDGALQTVATNSVWRTYNFSGASQLTFLNVVSNVLVAGDGAEKAVYQPALSLGSAYVVRITFTYESTTACVGLIARQNKGTPSGTGIFFDIVTAADGSLAAELGTSAGGTDLDSLNVPAGFLTAGAVTLELRVNGDVIQGVVNGTVLVQATSSNQSAQVGVGFFTTTDGTDPTRPLDNWEVYTGTNLASYRQTNIVVVSGGNVYVGDIDTQAALAAGGASQLHAANIPQGAFTTRKYYFVDGFNIRKLDLATRSMETYTATAGSAPTECTLACVYRDRLVLAAPRGDPQNFFFSRVGTHTDWDYTQTDPAAAFAGNASVAGRIGEPIVSIFPFSDDQLAIGGDHNLWVIRGDLADGGSIDLLSDAIGMLGAKSWCKSPDGTIYMAATGGLYRWRAGGIPEMLNAEGWPQFFQAINRGTHLVHLAWDRDKRGCHIFVTPVNSGAATHLWYDERMDGVFPEQFPNTHGPICALVYDGDAEIDRILLMGGRTGFVQKKDAAALSDDGTAINSFFLIPFQIGDGKNDSIIKCIDLTYGEPASGFDADDWSVACEIRAAKSAGDIVGNNHRKAKRDFGRQYGRVPSIVTFLRGAWGGLYISESSSTKHWSFENAIVTTEPVGKTRR